MGISIRLMLIPRRSIMKKLSLLPILGTLLLASCSEEKKESRNALPDPRDEKIARLEESLNELKAGAEKGRAQFRIQSEANTVVIGQLRDLLSDLKDKVETPKQVVEPPVVDTMEKDLEERRRILDSIRMARLVAVGEEHDLIVTERGEPFYDAVVTEVNDIGVSIRHRGGAGRIAFEDLPKSWQERFAYDPDRAAKSLEREQIARARYDIAASKELLAQKERNEKLDRELREARLALAVVQASQPPVTVVDQNPDLIPVRQTIIHDHYYDDHYSATPILEVPVIGGNRSGTYCPPSTQTFPPTSGVRPLAQHPLSTHREAVTSSPVTRPSASGGSPSRLSPGSTVQRPTVTSPAMQRPSSSPAVQRVAPAAVQQPSGQRPSVVHPVGRQSR